MDPEIKRVFVSRNVVFNEGKILVINYQEVWPSCYSENLRGSGKGMGVLIIRAVTIHCLDLEFSVSQYFNDE